MILKRGRSLLRSVLGELASRPLFSASFPRIGALGFSVNRGYLPLEVDVSLSKDAPRFAEWHYAGVR
jgi:hypothetical protein